MHSVFATNFPPKQALMENWLLLADVSEKINEKIGPEHCSPNILLKTLRPSLSNIQNRWSLILTETFASNFVYVKYM